MVLELVRTYLMASSKYGKLQTITEQGKSLFCSWSVVTSWADSPASPSLGFGYATAACPHLLCPGATAAQAGLCLSVHAPQLSAALTCLSALLVLHYGVSHLDPMRSHCTPCTCTQGQTHLLTLHLLALQVNTSALGPDLRRAPSKLATPPASAASQAYNPYAQPAAPAAASTPAAPPPSAPAAPSEPPPGTSILNADTSKVCCGQSPWLL